MGLPLKLFRSKIDCHLICTICEQVFKNPVCVSDGCSFCESCIVSKQDVELCPSDSNTIERTNGEIQRTPNKVLFGMIGFLEMACPFRLCDDVFPARDFEKHCQLCSFRPAGTPVSGYEYRAKNIVQDQATEVEKSVIDQATQTEESMQDQSTQVESNGQDQSTQIESSGQDQSTQAERNVEDKYTQEERSLKDQSTQKDEIVEDGTSKTESSVHGQEMEVLVQGFLQNIDELTAERDLLSQQCEELVKHNEQNLDFQAVQDVKPRIGTPRPSIFSGPCECGRDSDHADTPSTSKKRKMPARQAKSTPKPLKWSIDRKPGVEKNGECSGVGHVNQTESSKKQKRPLSAKSKKDTVSKTATNEMEKVLDSLSKTFLLLPRAIEGARTTDFELFFGKRRPVDEACQEKFRKLILSFNQISKFLSEKPTPLILLDFSKIDSCCLLMIHCLQHLIMPFGRYQVRCHNIQEVKKALGSLDTTTFTFRPASSSGEQDIVDKFDFVFSDPGDVRGRYFGAMNLNGVCLTLDESGNWLGWRRLLQAFRKEYEFWTHTP